VKIQQIPELSTWDGDKIAIQGVDVLTPDLWVKEATVLVAEGRFVSIDAAVVPNGFQAIDAQGLQMLPGIIDLHGDAFERAICPRLGVNIPLEMALVDNDRQLLAAGVTTFFCSITDSYEPGLRSRDSARLLINFIQGVGKQVLNCNHQIHLRHEEVNIKGHEELCEWLASGCIHLLSINNHLPDLSDRQQLDRSLNGMRRRLSLSDPEIIDFLSQQEANRFEGQQQVEQLVELAHTCGVPVASHDDDSEAKVALSQRRRVAIAEFPASVALAAQSRAYGAAVLMGAPNLVRGGSHVGWMSVAEAAGHRVLDCLCSDYHYPSLFHAPFKLDEMGLMPFEQAWKLISSRPAAAVGIGDRKGQIAIGWNADFLLVRPHNPQPSAIASVYITGQEVARYAIR